MQLCNRCEKNTATIGVHNPSTGGSLLCDTCFGEITGIPNPTAIFGGYTPSDRSGSAVVTPTRKAARQAESETPALDHFGRDITRQAHEGRIDPVIGRDREIEQTIEILARRRKNNAVLIGEPGVGKTAIVEGLARKIVEGSVPEMLRGARLVELDLSGMIAGASYRGQFEQRFKAALEELQQHPSIILFIDEVHTLVGAGAAEGAMDAANMLKPLLARGDIQVIGATTLDEYRTSIEADAALARRWSTVFVKEPSLEDTIEILRGVMSYYEEHHHVRISDETLVAAAQLADRYLHENRMPDKALDLLDGGASRLRLQHQGVGDTLEEIEHKIINREQEKQQAVDSEDFERAAWLKTDLLRLEQQRQQLLDQPELDTRLELTPALLAEVVARQTGIPVGNLHTQEMERLLDLESALHTRIIGQEQAVEAVADAVRRNRVALDDTHGTMGAFLFLGPTGVGKTELARTLAEQLFGSEDAMVRIDMSEYMEKHAVSRLIGSPPGYVGYGDGGQLTEPIRRRPYQVVLFDEVEKAHPDVLNILLQIFEDGRLTDGEGRTIDFSHTLVVMTSNLGAGGPKQSLGFAEQKINDNAGRLIESARRALRPELFNRIDEIIAFHPLDPQHIQYIARMMINRMGDRLVEEHGIRLDVTDEAISRLAADGFDADLGARPMRRHLRRTIERELTTAILKQTIAKDTTVIFDIENDQLVWTTKE